MVSRSKDRLEKARQEVLKYCQNKVEVKIHIQDFSKISQYNDYKENYNKRVNILTERYNGNL